MSSIGHLFSKRFNKVYIASSNSINGILTFDSDRVKELRPIGTHPLIDDFFSCAHFQVMHHGIHMNRAEKIKLISNWPIGLQNIFVCEGRISGENNCGRC